METQIDINLLMKDLEKLATRWDEFGGSQGRLAFEAYEVGHMGDYEKLMNTTEGYFACSHQLRDALKLRGYPL